MDWRSPELYDIVFNLGNADLEFVCEMAAHAVQQPQFQATPESIRAMKNLLISSRVRAALAGIPNIRLDRLAVVADGGVVTFRGRVKTKKQLDAVLEIAGQIPDIEKVENMIEVDYRSYGVE
jgi:osmotically-inducible protein OsmY